MTEEMYDELWDLDWIGIPDTPYVMKYRFDEDGYILLISNLTAVYGEKLYGKSLQERFQILNPHAEMLPKVILKHVKQSVQKILGGVETELKMTPDSNKVIIQHQFNISGVHFIFESEPHMLSDMQYKVLILRPILLRALKVDAQKAALQRKNEELEGKQSCSSPGYSDRKECEAIYSEIKENNSPGSAIIRAFLYLQKNNVTLPESQEGTPNVSSTKGIQSSTSRSKQPLPGKKIKDSKLATKNMSYEEGDSEVSFESRNKIQPSISIKIEKIEEDNMNEFEDSIVNLSEAHNGKQTVLMKRNNEEEKTILQLKKVSPSKKKKLMKF